MNATQGLAGDQRVQVGPKLSREQQKLIEKFSPTGDQILDNMNLLNEEVEESHPDFVEFAEIKTTEDEEDTIDMTDEITEDPNDTDLDEALKALSEEMGVSKKPEAKPKQTPSDEEEAPKPSSRSMVVDLLKKIPNAPTEKEINVMKKKHGANGVYVFAVSDHDVFIFTHLKRGQWQKIQSLMSEAAQKGQANVEDRLKETVLSHCILWPRPLSVEFFYNSKAGLVDSLYQTILTHSYFLTPEQVHMLTAQL